MKYYYLVLTHDAVEDITSNAGWYEKQEVGLGLEFVREVVEAIDSLLPNPLIFRLRNRRRNVRWILVKRFPFKVVYQVQEDRIEVFAVLHAARHDRNWELRG